MNTSDSDSGADFDSGSRRSRPTWLLVGVALVVLIVLVIAFVLAGRGDSTASDSASPPKTPAVDLSATATAEADSAVSTPPTSPTPSNQPVGDVSYFVEQGAGKWRIFAVGINGNQVTAEERYGPAGNDGGGCFVGDRVDSEFAGVLIADVGQKVAIPFKVNAGELRLKGKWRGLRPTTKQDVNQLTTAADQGPIDLVRCEEYRGLIASGEVQVID
jgi:hypothetical protein